MWVGTSEVLKTFLKIDCMASTASVPAHQVPHVAKEKEIRRCLRGQKPVPMKAVQIPVSQGRTEPL